MSHNHSHATAETKAVRIFCATVFAAYAFTLLFCQQGELLAHVQYVLSGGQTTYDILPGAVIITAVLLLLQWIVALIVRPCDSWYALTFMPSFLTLTIVNSFTQRVLMHFTLGPWVWCAPLLLVVFVVAVIVLRCCDKDRLRRHSPTAVAVFTSNAVTLLVMALLCGSFCNSNDVVLHECKAERLWMSKRYDEAAAVGLRSDETSQRLTMLRLLAQASRDSLAEHLFDYPQPYGVHGLLTLGDTDRRHYRVTSSDVYEFLGARPGRHIKDEQQYLARLIAHHRDHLDSVQTRLSGLTTISDSAVCDSVLRRCIQWRKIHLQRAVDYYLCALLLQRDTKHFVNELPFHYALTDTIGAPNATLPKSYREALAVAIPEHADSATLVRHAQYVAMRDSIVNPVHRTNLTRRAYGNTYWWYLDNR